MSEQKPIAQACPDFIELERGFSRRTFNNLIMGLGGGLILNAAEGLQVATAAIGDTRADAIITVYMRGGMDGLMAVPILGDPTLTRLRPTQRFADSKNLTLDNHFGLHPALNTLKQLYDQKQLAVIHSVGTPVGTRSHFDDQKALEYAAYNNPSNAEGWQNRYLQALGATDVFAGYSTGYNTPISLKGSAATTVFEDMNDVLLNNGSAMVNRSDYVNILKNMYASGKSLWATTASNSIAASERLRQVQAGISGDYPQTSNGRRFSTLAAMLKQGVNIKTANVEFQANFDVHSAAGIADGQTWNDLKDLDACVAAFKNDLADLWNHVTIVTVTEFGRRVEENASAGFDHGWASAMFVMGGGVKGGQVVATWPGLSDLRDGDLRVTLDYRHVLAEVMKYRGGMAADRISGVLPGFAAKDIGIVNQLN
ncbi:MAG: hypothetical protein RLZZ164_480 [Actinomycetota bacterium]|jgi:uncharacterized protein (DUF1501 family)